MRCNGLLLEWLLQLRQQRLYAWSPELHNCCALEWPLLDLQLYFHLRLVRKCLQMRFKLIPEYDWFLPILSLELHCL